MKKVLLSLAILFASLSMYANGEVTESYEIKNDEPVEIMIKGDFESGSSNYYNYKPAKKSPFGAAMLSFIIPGAGELYATNWEQGWGTVCFSYFVYPAGIFAGAYLFDDYDNYTTFLFIWSIFEISTWISSIASAATLAKKVNVKNGYVSFKVGDDAYLGLRPEISYNDNISQSSNAGLFSAGVGLSLSF